jgi:hypothetical protein
MVEVTTLYRHRSLFGLRRCGITGPETQLPKAMEKDVLVEIPAGSTSRCKTRVVQCGSKL